MKELTEEIFDEWVKASTHADYFFYPPGVKEALENFFNVKEEEKEL